MKNRVILINESAGNDYFGCPNRLLSLGIDFIGLDKAIQEMYEIFYNEQEAKNIRTG